MKQKISLIFFAITTSLSINVAAQFQLSSLELPQNSIIETQTETLVTASNSKCRISYEILSPSRLETDIAQQILDDVIYLGLEPQHCNAFYVCHKGANNISGVGIKGYYNDSENHKSYVATATIALLNEDKIIRLNGYSEALYAAETDKLIFGWMKKEGQSSLDKSSSDGTTLFKNVIVGLSQYMSLFDNKETDKLTSEAYTKFKTTFDYEAPASTIMNKALIRLNSSVTSQGQVVTKNVNQEKCTFWAILIADTEDESIGTEDIRDNRNLNNEINSICRCLGIECKIVNITGKATYNKANLAQAISNLKPSSNDIIFFSYNGHGFRWDDQKDYYPMMYLFDGKGDFSNQYVSVTDVYNAIIAKGARLNLIFADCCNSKFGAKAPKQQGNTLFSRTASNVSVNRLKELFLNSKGTTLAAAAKPGEYAYSFTDQGSAFTSNFIQTLRNEVSNSKTTEATWKNVVDGAISGAIKQTSECTNAQHGIRYMNVTKK